MACSPSPAPPNINAEVRPCFSGALWRHSVLLSHRRGVPGAGEDSVPAPFRPARSRVAKLTSSQELVDPRSQRLLPCPWSPDDMLAAEGSTSDAVCRLVSSRIFFPGSHPVRGVQVMKVGKLQLHQGMFPQAMRNLRLVSAPASCRFPLHTCIHTRVPTPAPTPYTCAHSPARQCFIPAPKHKTKQLVREVCPRLVCTCPPRPVLNHRCQINRLTKLMVWARGGSPRVQREPRAPRARGDSLRGDT